MYRYIVLIISVCSAFNVFAQQNISQRINDLIASPNVEKCSVLLREIEDSDIFSMTDSELFDYYYLVGWYCSEHDDYKGQINYLTKAKEICEKSLGIRQVVYLEIMYTLASAYEEIGDLNNALAVYQEGVVKGISMRIAAATEFAKLNSGLALAYEKKNWHKEVPQMWRNAWEFWAKDDIEYDTYSVYPLYMLSYYYVKRGEYDQALATNEEIADYLSTRTERTNIVWSDILYQKGVILNHQGKYADAVKTYREGIEIAQKDNIGNEKSENLYNDLINNLYGNLICALAEFESIPKINVVLDEIQTVCPSLYSQALFAASNILEKHKRYKEAFEYVNRAIPFVSGAEKEKFIKFANLYKQELDNQQVLEELCMYPVASEGSNCWLVYMEELANAYYVDKNKEKARDILAQLVEYTTKNGYPASEKNRLISLLVECAADINDDITVIKYSKDLMELAKSLYGELSKQYYYALNTVTVAYIRTNNYEQAKSMLETSGPLCIELFGKDSQPYSVELHNNGRVAQLAGNLELARDLYEESLSFYSRNNAPESLINRTKVCLGEVELLLKEQP